MFTCIQNLKNFKVVQLTNSMGMHRNIQLKNTAMWTVGLDSIVSIATPYGLDGLGMESWCG